VVELFHTSNNGVTFGLILTEFCFVLQEKTDPDKMRSLKRSQTGGTVSAHCPSFNCLPVSFALLGSSRSLDKEGPFVVR